MRGTLPAPQLNMTPEEAQARFDELQKKLVPLWQSIRSFNQDEQTIVIVPSMNIDAEFLGNELQAYEERFLFMLLLLRQPRARLIYVTSQMIHPSIVDYYLDMLPGVIPSQARRRLFLISPLDCSSRSLSLKLLERPRLLQQIRDLIINPDFAHLVPYNTTQLERDLAIQLGIPMYGADPKFFPLGTKTGCRRIFTEENVVHPLGIEDLHSREEAIAAIQKMTAEKGSGLDQVILKLNEGVSGEGNALLRLGGESSPAGIEAAMQKMEFEADYMTHESFMTKLAARGGVVEERITGEEMRNPSVQLRNTPNGEVQLLSTHDQILGGANGQSYMGCRFPADVEYAAAITREAEKVGKRLAKEGVIGRYALDFVAARTPSKGETDWRISAIEINLRKGGTTHPFLTLQFLTDGTYDPEAAKFTTPSGQEKHFVASDHLESPLYRAFTPDDLFDIAVRHGLHFDTACQTGAVFHMMSALGDMGSVGLTAVGNSPEHANEIYERTIQVLNDEAEAYLLVDTAPAPEGATPRYGVAV